MSYTKSTYSNPAIPLLDLLGDEHFIKTIKSALYLAGLEVPQYCTYHRSGKNMNNLFKIDVFIFNEGSGKLDIISCEKYLSGSLSTSFETIKFEHYQIFKQIIERGLYNGPE